MNAMTDKRTLKLAALVAACLFASAPAHAQQTQPDQSADAAPADDLKPVTDASKANEDGGGRRHLSKGFITPARPN